MLKNVKTRIVKLYKRYDKKKRGTIKREDKKRIIKDK